MAGTVQASPVSAQQSAEMDLCSELRFAMTISKTITLDVTLTALEYFHLLFVILGVLLLHLFVIPDVKMALSTIPKYVTMDSSLRILRAVITFVPKSCPGGAAPKGIIPLEAFAILFVGMACVWELKPAMILTLKTQMGVHLHAR